MTKDFLVARQEIQINDQFCLGIASEVNSICTVTSDEEPVFMIKCFS